MKKLLSLVLAVTMLLSAAVFTTTAASNTCIRLSSNTSGELGYSAGSDAINNYVASSGGVTLIFDVYVESYGTATDGFFSQIAAFTGDSNYNYVGYNFGKGAFTAGEGDAWIAGSQSNFNCYSSRDFKLEKGVWYELAYQFDGNEIVAYVDGTPMVAAEIDKASLQYIILYPQFCTVLLDNIRICDKDYNVRDRVGTVYATETFTGVTSVSGVSNWDFAGPGYSISQNGRPMTELEDMIPNRVVDPQISGTYLQYKEAGGKGAATIGYNFSEYNGFVVSENIRVDRKSAGANFSVRFGSNYIAGYEWDSQCFKIAKRAGDGFTSSAADTYAKVDYALTLGTTYEFAVRQAGNMVSIYINGVMVAQATNDAFIAGFSDIQLNHYRVGAAIDNLVVAYPDYDVKEAAGNVIAKLTFEESVNYVNSFGGFNIGTAGYGYSIVKGSTSAQVKVTGATAADGVATVGISLANCPGYDAFEMSVLYASGLSVKSVKETEIAGGVTAASVTSKNPFMYSCVTDGTPITNTDVIDITFAVPAAAGDYSVGVTVTPYVNGVPYTTITATGIVTVPKGEVVKSEITGLGYDGETLYWDYLDGAEVYDICVIYSDGYEECLDTTDESEYELIFEDWFSDPDEYKFVIYAYNDSYDVIGVSDTYSVIYTEDEEFFYGLDSYASYLFDNLLALVNDRDYSSANQAVVDATLAEAESALYAADYSTMLDLYDEYYAQLDEIPEGEDEVETFLPGDANGDGVLSSTDLSYLSKILSGADLDKYPGADVDGNGSVTGTDLTALQRKISG